MVTPIWECFRLFHCLLFKLFVSITHDVFACHCHRKLKCSLGKTCNASWEAYNCLVYSVLPTMQYFKGCVNGCSCELCCVSFSTAEVTCQVLASGAPVLLFHLSTTEDCLVPLTYQCAQVATNQ